MSRLSVSLLIVVAMVACAAADFWQLSGETCKSMESPAAEFGALQEACAEWKSIATDALECFPPEDVDAAAQSAPGWTLTNTTEGPTLFRSFQFGDFRDAFYFMTESAQLADKNEHHPAWSNLYNTVDVTWATDDQACLSNYDVYMAQSMTLLFDSFPAAPTK